VGWLFDLAHAGHLSASLTGEEEEVEGSFFGKDDRERSKTRDRDDGIALIVLSSI